MRKELILIGAMLLLILAVSQAQVFTADVYKTDRPSLLVNETQVIISSEYLDLVLEPIPGKQTRWRITREEVITEPVVTTVNNTDLTYSGTWEHPSGLWGTVSHSSQVGATANYTFTGNRIEVISDYAPGHGKLGYTINSGTEKIVDLYKATRLNGQVVIDEPVPAGQNTITFRVISGTVLIDFIRIVK